MPPIFNQTCRFIGSHIGALVHSADIKDAVRLCEAYLVGRTDLIASSPGEAWQRFAQTSRQLRVSRVTPSEGVNYKIPFVYENSRATHLADLKNRLKLQKIINPIGDEYGAMLALGQWLGTRWDHGISSVPGGPKACDPTSIILAGEAGARFWCEIAAKVAVYAATCLGWPARLATASRDGYTWEHAVAELWSNLFNKWFALDTDFNLVFEHDGIPMSCFELCHYGQKRQDSGGLLARQFAPPKASLPPIDLIPFYRYVHIDMRNDWCTRPLAAGSPAGGDRATWWTGRQGMPFFLTAKKRVQNQSMFDWKVNSAAIYPIAFSYTDKVIEIGLTGYSPYLRTFEISIDEGPWNATTPANARLRLSEGPHQIQARLFDDEDQRHVAGPPAVVDLEIGPS